MSYIPVTEALVVLETAMIKDPEFAWGWHCNIAVAMQDEGVSYAVSNAGAARFMKNDFKVDTSKAPMPTEGGNNVIKSID